MSELNIIGIGGNDAPPNPRLPAYLLPALIGKYVTNNLLLVTSLHGAIANTTDPEQRALIQFNTEQKLGFAEKFVHKFYPETDIQVNIQNVTDEIPEERLLRLWSQLEHALAEEDRVKVLEALARFSRDRSSLDGAKLYTIQHPFWFKDIQVPQDTVGLDSYGSIRTIGGQQEGFFSGLREQLCKIPDQGIEEVVGVQIRRNAIQKTVINGLARVLQYGQATTGNHRVSVELEPSMSCGIREHYSGLKQFKAGLNGDINIIVNAVGEEAYNEFWESYRQSYLADSCNL
jgi:hypothetical protein